MSEKILIIDDDLDTLSLVDLMLQRKGYQTAAATNGEQGLLKMQEDIPDLLLLDVMMPGMDGYEVARQVRNNPQTSSIPILMFTAKSQMDDKISGFSAGADDYLTKPTHPSELQEHIQILLSRSISTDAEPITGQQSVHLQPKQKTQSTRQRKRTPDDVILSAFFEAWFENMPSPRGME